MKTIKLLLTSSVVVLALAANAQTTNSNAFKRGWDNIKGWTKIDSGDLYRSGEAHLDVSGTYTTVQPGGLGKLLDNDSTKGVWGVDVGVTYYPSKYLGFGVDAVCTDLNNPSSQIIDELNLNATVRYPFNRFSPYFSGTIGRSFQRGLYNFSAGPGIEFRLNKGIGLFADTRFQWQVDSSRDTLLTRAGVRFVF